MTLTIRNRLPGTVTAVTAGGAMTAVKARLDGGQEITSVVTGEAVRELGLAEGTAITVLVKSTEVALATGAPTGLSIRNRLPGSVLGITRGAAMATVTVAVGGGELTAAVTAEAVADLGLEVGSAVVALVKSTEVALAVR